MYTYSTSFAQGKLNKLVALFISTSFLVACSRQVAPVATTHTAPAKDSTIVTATLPAGQSLAVDSTAIAATSAASHAKIKNFYASHANKTQWLLHNQPSPLMAAFDSLVGNAAAYGLDPRDYDYTAIHEKVALLYTNNTPSAKTVAELDAYITEQTLKFAGHLANGKINDVARGRGLWLTAPRADAKAETLLNAVHTPADLYAAADNLQPANEQYRKLQRALAYYRALEKSSSRNVDIVKGVKVKPEERNAMIPLVRAKLSITDRHTYVAPYDSATATTDSLRYDAALVSAVKWFQQRHGLEPDGIIGERTLRFLNQPFKEKADVIALNMERMRWTRDKYSDHYVFVNIPAYMLTVVEQGKPALEMRVIVGAVDKPTPVFTDQVNHIVFSPTWTVPTSIIKEEILPRLRGDSAYYADKNYAFYKDEVAIDPTTEVWDDQVNPYKIRVVQQPGPDNSLGRVKFGMPNTMNVYLHDTPNHRLFTKDYRALSHGCVRLDEPAEFAAYLLRDQAGWNRDKIQSAMTAGQPATILLKKKYDVHIEYFTAWVDENGLVNFREDIYGHDKRQLQQLFTKEKASDVAGL